MPPAPEAAIRAAIESFVEPMLGVPLGEAGALRSLALHDGRATVELALGFPVGGYEQELREALAAHLGGCGIDAGVELRLVAEIPSLSANPAVRPLPGVANVVAIASGKGGVGKSTVAANLAVALSRQGARVGLLDADVYGPSQPRMMGLSGRRPSTADGRTFDPPESHGVKVMSIGLLMDEEQPMVWRGPMVTQALTQLLNGTRWGELDYLIVDMPPGTGDTQLTMAQNVPLSGTVIVTTPQDIALLDARKGLMMFRKVGVPVLGIVENMSVFVCPSCGQAAHVFGQGGGQGMAERYEVALLGELPLDLSVREQGDAGMPAVAASPASPAAQAYLRLARRAAAQLALAAARGAGDFPTITIEDDE